MMVALLPVLVVALNSHFYGNLVVYFLVLMAFEIFVSLLIVSGGKEVPDLCLCPVTAWVQSPTKPQTSLGQVWPGPGNQ